MTNKSVAVLVLGFGLIVLNLIYSANGRAVRTAIVGG